MLFAVISIDINKFNFGSSAHVMTSTNKNIEAMSLWTELTYCITSNYVFVNKNGMNVLAACVMHIWALPSLKTKVYSHTPESYGGF
jgi:hypothetical protein